MTIDNDDYVFADVYARARLRGDRDTMTQVANACVPYMESVFSHFENLSRQFLGYEPPQILLLHANELNADYLPELIRMLRARSYRFVNMDAALEDLSKRLRSPCQRPGAGFVDTTWSACYNPLSVVKQSP